MDRGVLMQSLGGSKFVEISPDKKHMRTRDEPGKWSLAGVEPTTFSTLDASVPAFVPGQMFRVPEATQSNATDVQPPETPDGAPPVMDATEEVSSRLDEMSVSVATAAESTATVSAEDTSVATDVDDDNTDVLPETTADAETSEDAAMERLNTTSDDIQQGNGYDFVM